MSTKSPINVAFGFFVVLAAVFFTLGCSSDDSDPTAPPTSPSPPPGPGTTTNVSINFSTFSPAFLTVRAGATVVWTNNENLEHTVTSDAGSELASGILSQGQSYSHTFNTTGMFTYHCSLHPAMTGAVTVQP